MDTITHALGGMLLARATKSNDTDDVKGLSLGPRLWAGFAAAAFPDIDIITRLFGTLTYLDMHRGITHSILFLPFWAYLLAIIFSKLSRNKYHWKDFYLISLIGIASHIAGDLITAYGTMVFAPFSIMKFSWPTTFIIDFYFSSIIILGIILFLSFRQQGKTIAITSLIMLFSYVGYQGVLHNKAVQVAESYSKIKDINVSQIYAMPQPFSPYHWKLIIKSDGQYLVSYINLVSEKIKIAGAEAGFFEKVDALYFPVNKNIWSEIKLFGEENSLQAKQVWDLDIMKPVRRFMMFPSVDLSVKSSANACIWFKDHRFVLDGIRQGPFKFGACKVKNNWSLFSLSDEIPVPVL